MSLKERITGIQESKAAKLICRYFNSAYFPAVTAAVVLLCYYLGWDVVSFWYLGICGVAILICCKEATPLLLIATVISTLVSLKNSPSPNNPYFLGSGSPYYGSTPVLVQLIIIVTLLLGSIIVRTVIGIVQRKFKFNPIFFGLCALCLALMLNGLFTENYDPMNLFYGAALSVIFLGIYCFVCTNITVDRNTFTKLSYYFLTLFAIMAVQLTVAYFTTEGLFTESGIHREKLFFGWATYNNIGSLLVVTMPAWFYLAGKNEKLSPLFLCGGLLNYTLSLMTMSRQAMLFGSLVFILCCVWHLFTVKGKRRIITACVMGGLLIAAAIVVGVLHEKFLDVLTFDNDLESDGNGRVGVWLNGLEMFKKSPAFGRGFFNDDKVWHWDYGAAGMDIIPRMYHNTFIQLLAGCGIIGLAAYVAHRAQTVISLIKNFSHDRIFISLAASGILLTSLLDNHIFYLFPTVIYTMLLGLFVLTEKKESKGADEIASGEEQPIKDGKVQADEQPQTEPGPLPDGQEQTDGLLQDEQPQTDGLPQTETLQQDDILQ